MSFRLQQELIMRLENKKFIITGGTGDLGIKFAEGIVAAGGKVALIARDQNKLNAARLELGEDNVFVVSADLSNMAAVENAFRKIWRHFAAILSAGTHKPLHIDHSLAEAEQSEKDLHAGIFLPCYNAGEVTQKLFREQGYGWIVNISSHAAVRTDLEGNLSYASYKAASRAFILSLHHELNLNNKDNLVRVTDIQPSTVNTPGNKKWLPEVEQQQAAVQPEVMVEWFIQQFDNPEVRLEMPFDGGKEAQFKPR